MISGKQQEVAKTIIMALGVVGVVSVMAIAPGLGKVIPLLQKVDTRRINQEVKRLYKRGLVEIVKRKNGVEEIRLTKKGREKLSQYNIDQLKVEKPIKWDGKWRVVIFDVPIAKNRSREMLRRKMKQLGFYKLQNSVFVHPYPCLEIVEFIRSYFGVKAEVEYLEAENLESQNKLINHFFV